MYNNQITGFYTLAHPFFDGWGLSQSNNYLKVWMKSITQASERQGVFAIVYLSSPLFTKPYEAELVEHARESFGENRVKFIEGSHIHPKKIFSEDIRERIADRHNTTVSGRGVFAYQCVMNLVYYTLEVFNIPFEKGSIDFLESIDKLSLFNKGNRPNEIFPNLIEREVKRIELGNEDYVRWLEKKVALFESCVNFKPVLEECLSLSTIKTYLGDKGFLEETFGEFKLSNLTDPFFDIQRNRKLLKIIYNYLLDPIHFYDEHDYGYLKRPKQWEANLQVVLEFRDALAEKILERPMKDGDTQTLQKIVNRAKWIHYPVINKII